MAEFVEVMRTARRMCNEMDECEVCPLYDGFSECCLLSDGSLCHMDSDFARYEADIMKWGAEHPEVRYPTWQEWHSTNFPDFEDYITPCNFMPMQEVEALMGKRCADIRCYQCIKLPIPADIAKKLGIKPKE